MNDHFPMLSFFSVILRLFGWLLFVGGVVSSIMQGVAFVKCSNCTLEIPWLLGNAALLTCGTITIVFGELVGVLFAIEANTRGAADAADRRSDQVSGAITHGRGSDRDGGTVTYCWKCGAEVLTTDLFCETCGERLVKKITVRNW